MIVSALVDVLWTTVVAASGGTADAVCFKEVMDLRSYALLAGGSQRLLAAAGYLMLFSIEPSAILQARTQMPADLPERIYFTGYTLFTLDIGDFVPAVRSQSCSRRLLPRRVFS